MVAILPLLLLSGAFAGKQEIDAIGQRDQERRFMDAQIGEMKTQAAMAAWELERSQRLAREDDDSRRGEQGLLAQMAEQEMRKNVGVTGMETIDTGLGPLSVPKLGDTQPGQTGMLAALQRGLSEGRINPEVARIALPYAQSEDTKKEIGRSLASMTNAVKFASRPTSDDPMPPEDVEMFNGLFQSVGALAESDPEKAIGELSTAGESLQKYNADRAEWRSVQMRSQRQLAGVDSLIAKAQQSLTLADTADERRLIEDKIDRLEAFKSGGIDTDLSSAQYNIAVDRALDRPTVTGDDPFDQAAKQASMETRAWAGQGIKAKTDKDVEDYFQRRFKSLLPFYQSKGADPAPTSTGTGGPYTVDGIVAAVRAQGMSDEQARAAIIELIQNGLVTEEAANKAADKLGLD